MEWKLTRTILYSYNNLTWIPQKNHSRMEEREWERSFLACECVRFEMGKRESLKGSERYLYSLTQRTSHWSKGIRRLRVKARIVRSPDQRFRHPIPSSETPGQMFEHPERTRGPFTPKGRTVCHWNVWAFERRWLKLEKLADRPLPRGGPSAIEKFTHPDPNPETLDICPDTLDFYRDTHIRHYMWCFWLSWIWKRISWELVPY